MAASSSSDSAVIPGNAYAVLVVGGTAGETFPTPERPWRDLGQQVSFLMNMGKVYDRLAEWIGPGRIICIAMLRETIGWLEECVRIGHPPCDEDKTERCREYYRVQTSELLEKKRAQYQGMLKDVRRSCQALLRSNDGRAHYDGELVTPETLMNVLTGFCPGEKEAMDEEKTKKKTTSTTTTTATTTATAQSERTKPDETKKAVSGGPVVPRKGVKSIFLWTNTHGGHHAVSVGTEEVKGETKPKPIDSGDILCDVCSKPHKLDRENSHDHSSLRTREWFMLMPHRTANTSLYDCVSTAGHVMDFKAESHLPSPLQRFYWQHIFKAIHVMQENEPGRVVVCLYQFCTAGGHLKWMENKALRRFHHTHRWPVFMMATARELQYSLGISFTEIFLDCLREDLGRDSKSRPPPSLKEVYDRSVKKYWTTHKVERDYNERATSPAALFGELQSVSGKDSGVSDLSVRDIFVNGAEGGAKEGRE